MEQACLTHLLPADLPDGIDRLYFGAEFCCWRMPDDDAILRAIDLCRGAGIPLTLVTPVFYPAWQKRAEQLVRLAAENLREGDELLFSDLGMAELVRSAGLDLALVCGRALSGQKRGPRILDLELTEQQRDYFRMGTWYGRTSAAVLREIGVARVELDNLLQGIAPLPEGFSGSLHLPWAMVTSSRNCPFREPRHDRPCTPACGAAFTLETPQTRTPLYQAGNTQFLRNDRMPDDPAGLGIDRIVRHLHLPA
ncbi:MAG: hypothetical protein D6751_11140 [Deltaproteobacteria bacterium]|nr:MAG: hypothetical protein D6751_11140 [Deltaproteobacteria bacterium]